MTYLELKQEVNRLQKHIETAEKLQVAVISDMPLQPWFELYLQKSWAEKGRIALIRRVPWEQRQERDDTFRELWIYWLSREVAFEIDPKNEKDGIWISAESVSDPMQLFYCQTYQTHQTQEYFAYPANSTVIDLEKLMLRIGLEKSLATTGRRWGDRYSEALQRETANEIVRVYENQYGRRKKCLVLDCDGVLWGGIISEDGPEGIQLSETGKGRIYQDFQKVTRQLNQHGIILAICSKNDEADVKQVFCSHTAMKLQEEDIAAWSVNWNPKSRQMADLAEKLQIDLQDMVFVDDSLWELEEVRSQYPQVAGVFFDPEKGERQIYEKLAEYFWLKPEDQNPQNRLRVQTYADNVKRENLRQKAASYEEFLEKLQTKIEVHQAIPSDLLRISDLSRRANQCTNGIRYTVEDLKKLVEGGYRLQAVFVSDIYRDLGLVGCIGIDPKDSRLDLFCLSCRALGRRLEQQLLAALPPEVNQIRWQDTGKNQRLLELIKQNGRWRL